MSASSGAQRRSWRPPPIEAQRLTLRENVLTSKRIWRILILGHYFYGETDTVACLVRALENLGHAVLSVDWHKQRLCENTPEKVDGYGPHFLSASALQPYLERFQPEIIVCAAGGICFASDVADDLKRQGHLLLGITLSDPDVQESVIAHVGQFDLHGTNSLVALERYQGAGLTNTVLFPFGVDRGYACAHVPPAPELAADVICMGNAEHRPERIKVMETVAQAIERVKVYGKGWGVPGAHPVRGMRQIQAMRDGKIHVNFPRTRAGFTNIKCGVFESVASGGVLATERFDEMERYFTFGKEILGYLDADDLVDQVRRLLAEPQRLESMRRASFARLGAEHLYEHRWMTFLDELERRLSAKKPLPPVQQIMRRRPTPENTARRKRRVVVYGFYGAGNTGDELILRAIAENIAQPDDPYQLVVAAYDANAVSASHGLQAFPRTDLPRGQSEVAAATALILGGGGLWHDYTFAPTGGLLALFTDNLSAITGYSKLPLLARVYDRPVHIFGMGVGPMTDPDARAYARFLARQSRSLSVRDARSKALLESIDGWDIPVDVYPDPVFALDLGTGNAAEALKGMTQGTMIIGVNLRPWSKGDEAAFQDRIAKALSTVAQMRPCLLLGIPLQHPQDTQVLQSVFAKLPPTVSRHLLDGDIICDPDVVIGAIKHCSVLIGMRFHACLVAHRVEVPVVGLAYDPKVEALFEQVGCPNLALPLAADGDTVVAALIGVMDGRDELKSRLRAQVSDLERRARLGFENLRLLLDQATTVTTPLLTASTPPPSRMREELLAKLRTAENTARNAEQALEKHTRALEEQHAREQQKLRQQLDALHASFQEVMRSKSWRITAPLRWTVSLAARVVRFIPRYRKKKP